MEYIIAILVASIGFLGTAITISFNNKSKEKDRKLDLKKSIYLEACSELSRASQYALDIVNIDNPYPAYDVKTSGSFNKIHLIADIDLLNTVIKLSAAIFDAIAELATMRLGVEAKANRMKYCLDEHSNNLEHYKNYTAMYKDVDSTEAIEDIGKEQNQISQKMKALIGEHDKLNEQIFKEKIELLKCGVKHNLLISPLMSEAIVKMRKELEISFTDVEEDRYRILMSDMSQQTKIKMDNFLINLENEVGNIDGFLSK